MSIFPTRIPDCKLHEGTIQQRIAPHQRTIKAYQLNEW